MNIYCIGKLEKFFEPQYRIDCDFEVKKEEIDAIAILNKWKEEAQLNFAERKIEETFFPFKNGEANYEVTDGVNSVLIWITTKSI